jgi:hypothetical protein
MDDGELARRKPTVGKSSRLKPLAFGSSSRWLLHVEGTKAVLFSSMVVDDRLYVSSLGGKVGARACVWRKQSVRGVLYGAHARR